MIMIEAKQFSLLALADVPDATDATPGSDAENLESSVTEVTVYSDRARLTREAVAEVQAVLLRAAGARARSGAPEGPVRPPRGAPAETAPAPAPAGDRPEPDR